MAFTPGDRLTVRGERWIVQETTIFADSTLLCLRSQDGVGARRTCRLLTPFDRPSAEHRDAVVCATSRRRWMHHLHAYRSTTFAFGEVTAPQRAAIDIHPFQLEPLLALVQGRASRFLLADEVGLGKTIQAGLVLTELRQRGWCNNALIVCPAGLRQQWVDELHRRFGVPAAVIDAASLAAASGSLPFDVNPWAVEPVVISSMDFLKQAEVLRAPAAMLWDLVIVDEAHHAAANSLRHQAVAVLSARARHVLLLTATPHAGDEDAYRALCSLGEVDGDPILLFRRTRKSAGLPRSRRVHLLPVALTAASAGMHTLLNAYLARLWAIARDSARRDLQLVAMVLGKRAFSSAWSLAASLERRISGLQGCLHGPTQTLLPFDFECEQSDDSRLPTVAGFDQLAEEQDALQRLLEAARLAQIGERKMHALQRIVRRVDEPMIVFTEYRDTLDAMAGAIGGLRRITTLHGGQTPAERHNSIHAFTSGAADVMLATDAGSEGLNLQATCRLVVNLELPWNPIRLEQRIGRVDRIGQPRTVHAINLFADGTAERTVLASLLRRIDRIRMSEIDIAACVIGHSQPPARPISNEACARTVDLSAEARAAATRVTNARRHMASRSVFREESVPITVIKSAQASLTCFFRTRLVTHTGRLIEDGLLPVGIPIAHPAQRLSRRGARELATSLIGAFGSHLLERAELHASERAREIALQTSDWNKRTIDRERLIAHRASANPAAAMQPGLFDARVMKERGKADARRDAIARQAEARANTIEQDGIVHLAHQPELTMLLIRCSRG